VAIGVRSLIVFSIVLTTLPGLAAPLPQAADSSDFILHINQKIDPTMLTVTSMLRGPFGGYSQYGDALPRLRMTGPHDIAIGTVHEGQAAKSLRLVIYCRGYQFAFVDVPNLAARDSKTTAIDLVPLASVTLQGRVILPAGENPPQFTLEVAYDASALALEYFARGSGPSGYSFPSSLTPVATAALKSDGSFAAMVPDFFNDAAVAATRSKGTLHFGVHSRRKSYGLLAEEPAWPRPLGLPIAPSYADEIVLHVAARSASRY
jgi:hypothetical protein